MTELTSWEIHKYPVPTHGEFRLTLRRDSRFMQVGLDGKGAPSIWFVEDMLAPETSAPFIALFTGERIPNNCGPYIGTFQTPGKVDIEAGTRSLPLITHVFAV